MVPTSTDKRAFPELAPLRTPVALHIAGYNDRLYRASPQPVAATLDEEIARATEHFLSSRSALEEKVRQTRTQVYHQMAPAIEAGTLSTAWLLQALEQGTRPVTRPTVHRWRELNLLEYEGHDRPVADTVAAVLIASQVDPRSRGWLPGEIVREDEPLWWCWRQDSPDSPIIPCPVPLPPDLPRSTLLWTPWSGAAWDEHERWVSVGGGAVRWAKCRRIQHKVLWDLEVSDLKKWDTGTFPMSESVLESVPEVLDSVAQMTLIHLAIARLHHRKSDASHPVH